MTNKIRSAKAKYHKNLIDENSHNTRSFWKTMKKIIPGNESKPVRTDVMIDGKLCNNKKLIANAFNTHFTETASRALSVSWKRL